MVIVAAILCFLALLVGAVVVHTRAPSLPRDQNATQDGGISRRFRIILAAELIGLVVIARILVATGHSELIAAVVYLGVGVHFFPPRDVHHQTQR